MTEPLTGIRVLEMATAIQGPGAEANGAILARLGFGADEIETVAAQAAAQREAALALAAAAAAGTNAN